VQSRQEVEFLAPEVRVASREEDKEHRRAMWQLVAHESDEVSMSRYKQEHPDKVQAEYEFFAVRDMASAEMKIKEKKEDKLNETMWQIDAQESNEVAMARYKVEHPEEVHAEYEFFSTRDAAKKYEVKNKDNAAPSAVVEEDKNDPFYIDTSHQPVHQHGLAILKGI
jgi:DNA-directed RNA polymerase subunit L